MSRARPERALDKLIVRWLPSKLTEEEFRLSVGKWQESITWLRFEAGTVPEGVGGQRPTPGCAYLQIRNPEVAADLSMALDGAGYRDSAGMMCRCMVEWAPCQRVPVKSREDSRAGSLEQDEVYKAFVDDLTKEKPPPLSAEAALEAREKEKAKREGEVVVTPLLQYLKDKQQRAAAKKAKDMRGKQATALKERQEKLLVAQREARSKAQEQRLAKKAERKVGGEKKVLATAALVKAAMEEAAHESAERKGKGKGGKGAGKGREARAAEQVAAYPPLVVDGCCARARAPHARARTCSAHTPHMLRTHAAHAPHTRRTCSAHTPQVVDDGVVSKLVEMGFAKGHAASGVRANHGKSEEQIVQWLVEHPPKGGGGKGGGKGGEPKGGESEGGRGGRSARPDRAVYRPGKGGRGGRGGRGSGDGDGGGGAVSSSS